MRMFGLVPSVVDVTTMSVGPTGSTVLTGVKRSATAAPMVALPGRSVGPSTLVPAHVVPERAPV